jgi:hypothetical protein
LINGVLWGKQFSSSLVRHNYFGSQMEHVICLFCGQVELLVIVHELLEDHGLCCAGKYCESDEGMFLILIIKNLLALEIKLKNRS